MRKRLSRCTLLGITVTILGLFSTGCQTSSWSTWSWPGTSWLTGKKATSSEYQTPDKPASGYSSLPVDQAQKYTDPQAAPLPVDNPTVQNTQAGTYTNSYPATNQGNSNYLSPPANAQQPVDPYVTPQGNQPQQGLYNSNQYGNGQNPQYGNGQNSQLLPPAAVPVTTGGFQAPPASTTSPDDNNYNQGFYKPSEGQFGTPSPQDTDSFPINPDSTSAQPVTQEPVYTGQLPAATGTQIDGLPANAVPAGLPAVPAPGAYRPGSTGGY